MFTLIRRAMSYSQKKRVLEMRTALPAIARIGEIGSLIASTLGESLYRTGAFFGSSSQFVKNRAYLIQLPVGTRPDLSSAN
jgi:hypothetical protein